MGFNIVSVASCLLVLLAGEAQAGINPRSWVATPDPAANLFGVLKIAEGAVAALSPSSTKDITGVDSAAVNEKCVRRSGLTMVQQGILAYGLLFGEQSLEKSVAMGATLWIAETVACILNEESENVGPAAWADGVVLALAATTAITGFREMEIGSTVVKVVGIFQVLNGILCNFAPKSAEKAWDLGGTNDRTTSLVGRLGCEQLSVGVLQTALVFGVEPITAFGYAAVTTTISLAKTLYFDESSEKLGLKNRIKALLVAIPAILAGCILYPRD